MRSLSRQISATLAVLALLPVNIYSADKKKDPDEIGNRDVGKGINFYSIEKEIALGKQLATEVERQARIVDDPVIAEYVSRVGQNLVRNSDAKVPFTIKVIDGDEVNAFALPGGFFFVYTGILMKADSEAEMAGVMAHEIAPRSGSARYAAGNQRPADQLWNDSTDLYERHCGVCDPAGCEFGDSSGILEVLARE